MNVKDGRCKETESWPRIVCSGVKGMTEGEKDTVGIGEDLFGQFRSYFSWHIKQAVGAHVDVRLISIRLV